MYEDSTLVLGMTAILSVIVILLISSFEIGIYSDFGWYEKEYENTMSRKIWR
mgnify:CR=1 FL=1